MAFSGSWMLSSTPKLASMITSCTTQHYMSGAALVQADDGSGHHAAQHNSDIDLLLLSAS